MDYVSEKTYNIQERKEEEIVFSYANEYKRDSADEKAFLSIYGLPGTGKSTMIRNVSNTIKKGLKIFSACIDISDCTTVIDVYHRLALEVNAYYTDKRQGKNDSNSQKIKDFLNLYNWIYGTNKEFPQSGDYKNNVRSKIGIFLSKNIIKTKHFKELITSLMFELAQEYIPVFDTLQETITAILEKETDWQKRQFIIQFKEAFSSKTIREEILKSKLCEAMADLHKPVIILDNFQLEVNNELGGSQSWLIQESGLISRINAFWIIVGRNSTNDLLEHYNQGGKLFEEIKLEGFDMDIADEYIRNACFDGKAVNEFSKEDEELRKKMLLVCACASPKQNNEATYLPYLLKMIADYYNKLKKKTEQVKSEQFLCIREQAEFVGYYFYMNLSDLMINAFQILSCLPEWDKMWIDVVREKFDNHLLNASNLLHKSAPLEDLGEGRFKLHEAVKDGLYNEPSNYIKLDILEYLFKVFQDIYCNDTNNVKNQKNADEMEWYRSGRLTTFLEVVCNYVKLQPPKWQRKKLEELQKPISIIYNKNSGRGVVDDGFIRAYIIYIDLLREVYQVPFVSLKEWQSKECNVNNRIKVADFEISDLRKFMQCCFNLADLYTNNNQSEIANCFEKKCVEFLQEISAINDINENQLKQFRVRQLIAKFTNAMAFDMSASGDTANALDILNDGMKNLKVLALDLIKVIKEKKLFKEGEEASCKLLVDFEQSAEYKCLCDEKGQDYFNNLNIDVPLNISSKLKCAYTKLIEFKSQAKKEKEDTLIAVFSELMLVEHQKMRGNLPWYAIKSNKDNVDEIWRFGLHTYWMRRVLVETANSLVSEKEIKEYQKNMLKAYHNVCVYMSKNGKLEWACITEREVMDESFLLLPNKSELKGFAKERFDMLHVLEANKANDDLMGSLYDKCKQKGEIKDSFFLEHDEILEQKQYLGDYYLNMKLYVRAFNIFSQILLKRYVAFGYYDNKTLDSLLRFVIAAFASNNEKSIDKVQRWCEFNKRGFSDLNVDKRISDKQDRVHKMCEVARNTNESEANRLNRLFEILKGA